MRGTDRAEVNLEHQAADLVEVVISIAAPKTKIRKSAQADLVIQPSCKNIALAPTGKSVVPLRASRAHKRGASRSSRTLGAGCDGRLDAQDEHVKADGEVVWF